jgi:hypothetical protein
LILLGNLSKQLKHIALVLQTDAYPSVKYFELHSLYYLNKFVNVLHPQRLAANSYFDATFICKFRTVAQDIDQNLFQPLEVALNGLRNIVVHVIR